jgi:thiol-disulfide isomerase/thioredoxin
MWAAIGVVVVLGIVAIVIASGSGGGESSGGVDQFGTPKVSGTALTPYSSFGRDPAVGEQAPTVRGQSFAGRPVAIAPDGKPRMIVFLAHWCPHCNVEAPKLAAYLDEHGLPANVDLTIVPTGSNSSAPNWPPSEWVKDIGLGNVQTLVDDEQGTVAAAYGLTAYPFIVMLDAQGKVLDRTSGEQENGFFAQAFNRLAG